MTIELTAEGIQIQGIAEIIAESQARFRELFGENIGVSANSVFGQQIAANAEREALVQELIEAVYQSFDPRFATGVSLDARAALNGIFRKPATNSKSTSFLATGTPAVPITNGSQFQLIQTADIWEVVDGPFVIDGGGTIAVTAQAVETGPKAFLTTGPAGWSILTPIAGWTSIESTADLDPEDTGSDIESDIALRTRRVDELLIQGNDVDAIRAAVGALVGVTTVAVFDNTSCVVALDGIPPGAFEVVVDGGVDADIAAAIFSRKPPGAESFGSTGPFPQTTSEGQIIDIFLTRPTDIDIDVEIDATATGAEFPLPLNAAATIAAAALEAFNTDAQVSRDIFPGKYTTVVFVSIQTDAGEDTIVSAEVRMRVGIDPFATTPIVISLRERSDFDSANITVAIL